MIGAPPGGGYDIYGRVVARHIGRHIPGNPTIVPKNMPGAGSAVRPATSAKRRAQGRHRHRQHHAGRRHRSAARSQGAETVRSDQGAYIGNVNNGIRVCVSGEQVQDQDLRRRPHAEGEVRRRGANDSTHDYGFMHKHTTGAI